MSTQVFRRAVIEACEVRRMLVTYQVEGTSGADTISISISGNSIISVVNGVSDSASDLINNTVEITALGGNDTISITETGNNVVIVNAGTGDDTVNVGNGAGDLDVIDDSVIVNGEGNNDLLVLHDQNQSAVSILQSSSGNAYSRAGVPAITANVERVTLRLSGQAAEAVRFNDPPSAAVTVDGAAPDNVVQLDGVGSRSGTFTPHAADSHAGTLSFATSTITLLDCDGVYFDDFATATLTTPNPADQLSVASSATETVLNGVSGGVDLMETTVTSAATLLLDVATNDGAAGNDRILGFSTLNGADRLLLNAGVGTNSLELLAGTWNVSTAIGLGGVNLDVLVDSADVTFSGSQTLRQLELRDDGRATLAGNPVTMTIQNRLAIGAGGGTLDVDANNTATLAGTGLLQIGAAATLTKTGAGTLRVDAPQQHAVGASFVNNGGTTRFSSDAGSADQRRLSLHAQQGEIQVVSDQHLRSLSTEFGHVVMPPLGPRVIVTELLNAGGEAGFVDVGNNSLIVDYTGPSPLPAVLQQLVNGYAGGAWNGLGVNSSVAANATHTGVGYAEATDLFATFPATFSGQAIDNTAILIRHTYNGDTNLDRLVSFDDLLKLAQHYGPSTGGRSWNQGNSTYNSVDNVPFAVSFDDLLMLAQNYETSVPAVSWGPKDRQAAPGALLVL